jgi:hypothetical protein
VRLADDTCARLQTESLTLVAAIVGARRASDASAVAAR